ncbi:MAG: DNA methyltransferase [bacterium]
MSSAMGRRKERKSGLAAENRAGAGIVRLRLDELDICPELARLYQQPQGLDELEQSLLRDGQLSPILVEPWGNAFQVISGARRLAAAKRLGWSEIAAVVRQPADDDQRRWWILASNQQRAKRFSDRMREADLMEQLLQAEARARSLANLEQGRGLKIYDEARECLNSDTPAGQGRADSAGRGRKTQPQRTDAAIAEAIGIGGKDIYRQARAVWLAAGSGDERARQLLAELDAGMKTVFAAFKDLRRRDHLATDFVPTPYDVWSFKHDRSYGMRYPGSIPAGIVANTIYYFSQPGDLVVDPMAGGGTTVDVCQSLGRKCLAYDIKPSRQDISRWNIAEMSLPEEARGCDLVFLDPPYFSMLREQYDPASVSSLGMEGWRQSMACVYQNIYAILRPGGVVAVLIANQTERDVPENCNYIDHVFETYGILNAMGLKPLRRISCPMESTYRPDEITKSREERKLLGQVRDLLVFRKAN